MSKDSLFEKLDSALRNKAAAVRLNIDLEPAEGAEGKVFPPTYDGNEYATENRCIQGKIENCVLIDSVASQANRQELVIQKAISNGTLKQPDIRLQLATLDKQLSTMELPHRVFDAAVRDSLLNNVPFRQTPLGEQIIASNFNCATALFESSPTTLLYGGWDSHARNKGHGVRLQRALTSEIVAKGVIEGRTVGGRLDPLMINKDAAIIYQATSSEEQWTLQESTALKNKGKAELMPSKKNDSKGKPAAIGHGNIPPSIKTTGGITCKNIQQTSVLSLTQLRQMYFPDLSTGECNQDRDHACRMVLAALALHALALQFDEGYDLRSRCLLIPKAVPSFEIIGTTSADINEHRLDSGETLKTLNKAIKNLNKHGINWNTEPVILTAQEKLETLIKNSHEMTTAEGQ